MAGDEWLEYGANLIVISCIICPIFKEISLLLNEASVYIMYSDNTGVIR